MKEHILVGLSSAPSIAGIIRTHTGIGYRMLQNE